VQVKVLYNGAETHLLNEGFLYVTISDPCLVASGGAITAQSITDINYWIKDSLSTTTLTTFLDAPTTRDGGQTHLYLNGGDLCGSKTYEIVMADQETSNPNTAYLTLRTDAYGVYIDVDTTNPAYYTNS
jgi:hypothetical protein